MDLINLYQKVIADYSKITVNHREMNEANYIERGHNPSCGDDITLLANISDGILKDISFLGQGCAISTASTNMMIEIVKNKKINDVQQIINTFFEMIKNEDVKDKYNDLLGDTTLLHLTYNMPARIKCATLSWHTLNIILNNKGDVYVKD